MHGQLTRFLFYYGLPYCICFNCVLLLFFFPLSFLFHHLGIQVDVQSQDSLNCLLPSKVANQVLKRAINAQEPEDSLTEEDLALAASLE